MNEIALKAAQENKEAYCLCSQDVRDALQEAGKENCIVLCGTGWYDEELFTRPNTYRIRSDYKLKPEKRLVRYEVVSEKDTANRQILYVKHESHYLLLCVMGWANFSHCIFDVPKVGEVPGQDFRIWHDGDGCYSFVPSDNCNIMLTPNAVEVYE